jgi:hypothetical protein
MMGGVTIRWLTVFLDFPAPAFEPCVAFWREVTGSGLSAFRGRHGEFATLLPSSGEAYLRVQRVLDGDGGCHLDLHVDISAQSLDDLASRAAGLGATIRHRDPDGGLVIAGTPGGFTFCLVRWHGEVTVPGPLLTGSGTSQVDTLCLDVPPPEFQRECAFWSALTGWALRPARVAGYTYLEQPPGLPVHILLQRLDAAEPGQQVRGHVDFGCTDGQAIARHEALGARVTGTHQFWTVLADPAGRPYCLVDRNP